MPMSAARASSIPRPVPMTKARAARPARDTCSTRRIAAGRDVTAIRCSPPRFGAERLPRPRLDGKSPIYLRAERVAVGRVPGPVAGREPLDTLLGRTMGPGFRRHSALRRLLDPVVADRRGGTQGLVDVARFEIGRVRMGPHASEAVSLQLGANREVVLARWVLG